MNETFEQELTAHDQAIAATGLEIWAGAEPTFTRHGSDAPEWLSEALGEDKPAVARRLMEALVARHPGAVVLRTLGRQYPGEPEPRWSLGLYARRDGEPIWPGPPDPLLKPASVDHENLRQFRDTLAQRLAALGWRSAAVDGGSSLGLRIAVRVDGLPVPTDLGREPRLGRDSVHAAPIPPRGLEDDLAADGIYLVAIGTFTERLCSSCPCIELPAIERVEEFLACLDAVGRSALQTGLSSLVIRGFPPPVDARIAWTTITPDPAVIEVNQAPYQDAARFLAASREIHAVAAEIGLSPYRLQFNGTVSDSGGGGQLTLGGPTPEASPFFVAPALLPRLIRYVNNHPSLSYLFAPDYVGSSSQSPRTDESVRESFQELDFALEILEKNPRVDPERLWQSLSHFLTDPSGNPHRSELNIEKLWNPYLHGRGCLGLVEFRAFRMSLTPERAAAIVALLRGIAAMLAAHDKAPQLKYWGNSLHDRFALPFYLLQDLNFVFNDLRASGLGLGPAVEAILRDDPGRARWTTEFYGCHLEIEKAVEFWPLVGDVASQESGASRLVDASTARLQVLLCTADDNAPPIDGWQLLANGYEIPLHRAHGPQGVVRLTGLRYRDFVPWIGLHPGLEAHGPVNLVFTHPGIDDALSVSLHNWCPDGTPYRGLPENLADAAQRRAERLVLQRVPRASLPPFTVPPRTALCEHSIDLRRL